MSQADSGLAGVLGAVQISQESDRGYPAEFDGEDDLNAAEPWEWSCGRPGEACRQEIAIGR